MTHIVNKPADTQTIAQGPADIRAEIAKVANDQVTDAGTLKGLSPGNKAGQIPVNNGVVNSGLNAEKLGGNLPSAFSPANHAHAVATSSSDGFIDNASWNKLQGVAAGAEVNQNAFSNVLVNGKTIQADAKTDTLELAAGANITLTPDVTNDRVTISVSGKVTNASYADSAGSAPANGGNAGTVGGYGVGKAGVANSVVVRDASGYIQNTWYNSQRASENSAAAQYLYDSGDGYMRKKDLANVRKEILAGQSLPASGGTADSAARLLPISGPATYKLAYTADGARTNAGEWGRVVMRNDSNGQTYGVRCDRADQADRAAVMVNYDPRGEAFTASKQKASSAFSTTGTDPIWSSVKTTKSAAAPGIPDAWPVTPDAIDATATFYTRGKTSGETSVTNARHLYERVTAGVPAGTYTLKSILQELINRSHIHEIRGRESAYINNCNCDCNCGDDNFS
ncbi:MAG: hypothetical protein E6X17_09850 [Sporomusaceae bacterium]|nr:hypothetical protein [Sporomusaceae bacterium]